MLKMKMKNKTLKFYQNLGELFYAIAAAGQRDIHQSLIN